jgi:outer membrane biosynthesis protein TonB
VVQAVIDTAGRAEPASVRVIQSADTAFDQDAQQWMLEALWRPARVAGHPVRLRVNRAIDYTSTRRR